MGQEQGKPAGEGLDRPSTPVRRNPRVAPQNHDVIDDEEGPSMFADLSVASKAAATRTAAVATHEPDATTESNVDVQESEPSTSAFGFISGAADQDEANEDQSEPPSGTTEDSPSTSAFGFISDSSAASQPEAPESQPNQDAEPPTTPTVTTTTTSSSAPSSGRKKKLTLAKRPGYAAASDATPPPAAVAEPAQPSEKDKTPQKSKPTPTPPPAQQRREESQPQPEEETEALAPTKATPVAPKIAQSNPDSVEVKLQTLENELESIRTKLRDIIEKQIGSKRALRDLHTATAELLRQRRELERVQQRASEEENFEKAEELSEKLSQCKIELEQQQDRIQQELTVLLDLHVQRRALFQAEIALRKGSLSQLQRLEEEQLEALSSLGAKIAHQRSANEEQLSQRSEDLTKELSHVELDMKLVEERQSKIQLSIDEQTVQLRQDKQQWATKLDTVRDEIEELMAKLRAKQQEEVDYSHQIASIDEQIEAVSSKFAKELAKVVENKSRAAERAQTLQMEKEEIEKERHLLEESLSSLVSTQKHEESILAKIREDISSSNSAVSRAEQTGSAAEQVLNRLQGDISALDLWNKQIKAKHELISNIDAQIQELSEKSIQTAKSIQATKQRTLALKTEILPGLEAAKKAAATARNFKEAAQLQKEIKENQDEAARLEEKVAELTSRASEDAVELKRRSEELLAQSSQLLEMEKTHDLGRLKVLLDETVDLRVTIRRATKQEDYDSAYVATAELEAIRAEIAQIVVKHQLDEAAAAEPELPAEPVEPAVAVVVEEEEKKKNEDELPSSDSLEGAVVETPLVEVIDAPVGGDDDGDDTLSAFLRLSESGSASTQEAVNDDATVVSQDNEDDGSMFSGLLTDAAATADDSEHMGGLSNDATSSSVEEARGTYEGLSLDVVGLPSADDTTIATSAVGSSAPVEAVETTASHDAPAETSDEPEPDAPTEEVDDSSERRAAEKKALEEELAVQLEKKAELEANLDSACAAEDYDAAYEINNQIEAATNAIQELQDKIAALE